MEANVPMKRFALATLAAILALALGACGGDTPAPTTPTAPATPTTPSTSTPTSPVSPAPAAVAPAAAPAAAPATSGEQRPKTIDVPPAIRAVVDAPDRDPADKKLDSGRKPGELLAFAGIKPGMKVADLAAGGGYTTELLARAVGPTGVVYGQNSPMIVEKFAAKPWAARLAKPADKNVVKVTREFDDPLPPEAKDLDAVVMVQTLHRIDEAVVRKEVPLAGFKLAADADVWRNPDDKRDWNSSPMAAGEKRGTSDRFALKFVKP